MKNRVTVTIAGQEYTLVAAEDVRYVQRVASHVVFFALRIHSRIMFFECLSCILYSL